ncbi:peptidylprolyl isomerase [Saccharopolyspora kobensis]|uniref:peptidylprolyl isomerase n=1 Tax=Saccharopolyspora kobensis TaxID=146035 RepID=UPI00333193CD
MRLAIVGELSALLNSDSASAARSARTALTKLTDDNDSSVVAAAQAALARAETATPSSAAVVVRSEVVQQHSAESPSPPVAEGAPDSPVCDLTDHHGAPQQRGGDQQQARSPRTRRKALVVGTVLGVGAAAAAATTVSLLPDPEGSNDAAPPTGRVQVPPGYVTPPTRPVPLPDSVACYYQPDWANGVVPAKGIVLADINTNIGTIPVLLDRSLAPCTVNGFTHMAKQGVYQNTGCNSGDVQWLSCGPRDGSGYSWTDERFAGVRADLRGYLVMHHAYYGSYFSLYFEDGQKGDATVFGTISEEGLKLIDNKRRESNDVHNESLKEIIITSVDIQD